MRKLIFVPVLIAALLGGCTAVQIATAKASVNQVLANVQAVCHVILDNSSGAVAQFIDTFPLGTAAVTIANAVCIAIETAQPLAAPPNAKLGARLGAPEQSVVVHNVVIPYVRVR